MKPILVLFFLLLSIAIPVSAQTPPTAAAADQKQTIDPKPTQVQQQLMTAALKEVERAQAELVAAQAARDAAWRVVGGVVATIRTELKLPEDKWEAYLDQGNLKFRTVTAKNTKPKEPAKSDQ